MPVRERHVHRRPLDSSVLPLFLNTKSRFFNQFTLTPLPSPLTPPDRLRGGLQHQSQFPDDAEVSPNVFPLSLLKYVQTNPPFSLRFPILLKRLDRHPPL